MLHCLPLLLLFDFAMPLTFLLPMAIFHIRLLFIFFFMR